MKTAVIYARYSSERQTEQSIEGQMRVCHEYAKENDILIVDSYIDRAKLFVDAINTLKCSQGFYGRLYNYINEMDEDNYMDLYDLLEGQDFKDTLDVVFFLEC